MLSFPSLVPWSTKPKIIAKPDEFIAAFEKATIPVVFEKQKDRAWKAPSAKAVFVRIVKQTKILPYRHDHFILQRVIAENPGRGDGAAFMDMMTKLADETHINLGIFAEPIAHKAMDHDSLIKWLTERYGFESYNDPPGLLWREPSAP